MLFVPLLQTDVRIWGRDHYSVSFSPSQQIQIILTNEGDLTSVRVRYLASNIFDAETLFQIILTTKQQELFTWVKNICQPISMHWAETWFSVLILCENPFKWWNTFCVVCIVYHTEGVYFHALHSCTNILPNRFAISSVGLYFCTCLNVSLGPDKGLCCLCQVKSCQILLNTVCTNWQMDVKFCHFSQF